MPADASLCVFAQEETYIKIKPLTAFRSILLRGRYFGQCLFNKIISPLVLAPLVWSCDSCILCGRCVINIFRSDIKRCIRALRQRFL